jgi:uncharacterized protein (DUF1499 family)
VPPIHDITTDTERPPAFVAVLERRREAPNPPEYGGPPVAAQQKRGYPDLGPTTFAAPPDRALAAAEAAARGLDWEIVAVAPAEGRLEATATTPWFGFKDDVVVRVERAGTGSRVDVPRIARRRSDLGVNARRIRTSSPRSPRRSSRPHSTPVSAKTRGRRAADVAHEGRGGANRPAGRQQRRDVARMVLDGRRQRAHEPESPRLVWADLGDGADADLASRPADDMLHDRVAVGIADALRAHRVRDAHALQHALEVGAGRRAVEDERLAVEEGAPQRLRARHVGHGRAVAHHHRHPDSPHHHATVGAQPSRLGEGVDHGRRGDQEIGALARLDTLPEHIGHRDGQGHRVAGLTLEAEDKPAQPAPSRAELARSVAPAARTAGRAKTVRPR